MSIELNEIQLRGIYEQINLPALRESHGCKHLSYDRFKLMIKTLVNKGSLQAEAINNSQLDPTFFFQEILATYPELKFSGSYIEEQEKSSGGFGKVLFFLIILGALGYATYHFWDKIKEFIPK